MPRLGIGDLTEPEVMLTMRPNLRSHIPSTVALISMIGVSMLALTAFCQSSTDHSRKSPCGGPPQLLTRMSGLGLAARAAARPASVEMSPGTAVTLAPVSLRISSAVCSRVSAVRAVIVSSTPARPSDIAQARPNPLLAAQTRAFRPRIPKSSIVPSRWQKSPSRFIMGETDHVGNLAEQGVDIMAMVEWRVRADEFANCNCAYGCPCQFNALPTLGFCEATAGWKIHEGHFGDVPLDGLNTAFFIHFPGPVHEGNG